MKIFVGGVVGRYYEPDHVGSVMRLLRRPEVSAYKPRFNDALLCRGRAQVATEFLERSDADVLLSIDSDIVFEAADAIAVCEAAMEYSIVGGQYVTRGKGKHCYPASLVANGRRVEYAGSHKVVKARYVSGGFIATHRRVFERLAKRDDCPLLHESVESMRFRPFYTPFWTQGESELIYLSEDWAFCERAAQDGFPSYLDPAVRLLHVGMSAYRLEDMLQDEPLPTQPLALTREAGGLYTRESF